MSRMPIESRDPQTFAIIGAAMEVHKQMGCGFLENVYHEALRMELADRGIPFQSQVKLPIHYKDQKLECTYCADFICYGSVIVEIKALKQLSGVERAQAINYLKATGMRVALLINFWRHEPRIRTHRELNEINL